MTKKEIIRVWKDEDYRLSLSEAKLSAIPAHPAGVVELADDELVQMNGQTGGICIAVGTWLVSFGATHLMSCYAGCPATLHHGGTCEVAGAGCA